MGGVYSEENVIVVGVTQHAMWHFANWQLWNKLEDKLAWKGLAGLSDKEEIIEELQKAHGEWLGDHVVKNKLGNHAEGGKTQESLKKGGERAFDKKVGIFSQTEREWAETRRKGGESTKDQNKGIFSQTKEQLAALGAVSGRKIKEERKGIFSLNEEEHRENAKKGGIKSASTLWEDPNHPELGRHPANLLALRQKRSNLPHSKENRVKVVIDG